MIARRIDSAERPAAQPDDDAGHAAVADDQVGAEAEDRHRNLARQSRQEIGEVVFVSGREQDLGRSADAEPGERRERRVGGQAATQVGGERGDIGFQGGFHGRELRRWLRKTQHSPDRFRNTSPSREFLSQPQEGMMATNNPREPWTYPAEKARQGEIILRSRASRIIFIAALAGAVILAAALSWFYIPVH